MLATHGQETVGVDLRPSIWTQHVADVRRLPERLEFDAVVHAAAHVSVPRSVQEPRFDAAHNVDGTIAVLDAARRQDVSRFVFVSSAAVYGEAPASPIREEAPLEPCSPYGLSKLVGEQYVQLYRRLYGIPTVVLRPFNIFSGRQAPDNPYTGVISRFAQAIMNGQQLRIFGDGTQRRDFVHAQDVVQAIRITLSSPKAVAGTFNVGTGRGTTIRGLAETMLAVARSERRPRYEPPRTGDTRESVADISRLSALGFKPGTRLDHDILPLLLPRPEPSPREGVAATGRSPPKAGNSFTTL